MNKKFIIITSIYEPSEAILSFAKLNDWQLVVVGDTKTPIGWEHPNVTYLSPDFQSKMNSDLVNNLPWKSYSRKIAGYVFAIENGAEVIADTDDDNIPYEDWGVNFERNLELDIIEHKGFVNIYNYFTDSKVWPRGYPLNQILNSFDSKIQLKSTSLDSNKIGVFQFLADEDPDVDAIYRLTNNQPIYFKKRGLINLQPGAICPFNSQNTFFRKETFPLLYLPVHVNFRFTDILRGFIAQPILWASNYTLCFGHATAIQKRNPHDYLVDFESEIPCFLYPEKIMEMLMNKVSSKNSIVENLILSYETLYDNKIVIKEELKLVESWVKRF
jgi:hypothetical protein